jgi:uncharacterized protein YndB with AHSA1/START domain
MRERRATWEDAMRTLLTSAAVAAASLASADPARAEVTDVQPHGFQVRTVVEVAAEPDAVWAALTRKVGRWWHPQHTWSGDAGNLSIELRAGGCFCERWKGGQAAHMTVGQILGRRRLQLIGGLGPLQAEGATGAMIFVIEDAPGGSKLTMTYTVAGRISGGAEQWAPIVDQVTALQVGRLKSYAETGSPD